MIGLGQGLGTRLLQNSPSDSTMQPGFRTIGVEDGAERVKEEPSRRKRNRKMVLVMLKEGFSNNRNLSVGLKITERLIMCGVKHFWY